MSLANKLYNIGKSITDKKTIESLIQREPDTTVDYQTVAINFTTLKDKIVYDKVSNNFCKNSFYSEKLGGSGTAIYYLYPNIIIHNLNKKSTPYDKSFQLKATLENILANKYANGQNSIFLENILNEIENQAIFDTVKSYLKGNYLYLITINNKSLYEVMPEIWDNWFQNPSTHYTDLTTKNFYDYITSKEEEIGYSPDIGCYTVNNYNDTLKYRIIDNLPLSKESARYIKFGWLYTRKYLLFYFDGMQFAIIPSYSKTNDKEFKEIVLKLKTANEHSHKNRNTLKVLANEETNLQKQFAKLNKPKKKDTESIQKKAKELDEVVNRKNSLTAKIPNGLFTTFREEVKDLEFIQGLTLDFIFIELNKNEVKIFGSLEEVIPSRVLTVVEKIREHNIDDKIAPINKDYSQTYLRDFFHRDELYFYKMNKRKNDPKDTSYRAKILSERFYLAKLLLGGNQISSRDLHRRFEFNAEYDDEHNRRLNDKMVKVWIDNGKNSDRDEKNILSLFNELNILKD
jgi:CRISPR-associated protein Csh1